MRYDPLAHPEELIRRLYAYVAYRIGAGPDAEDVTSETFERALRYRKSYDRRKGEPVSWLIGIARNVIAELPRHPTVEVEERLDDPELEERTAVRVDLSRALAALQPRDRELLSLRYGADLTARQIGELLGLKTNAVEVALHRALGRLRAELLTEAAA
ncbi:MAG TPA: RNA polymerase sigma factor [Gaiellaceae bacterium]|nr:RNA polymerase sigma factor [Gaiellaceae bacterium]